MFVGMPPGYSACTGIPRGGRPVTTTPDPPNNTPGTGDQPAEEPVEDLSAQQPRPPIDGRKVDGDGQD